MAYDKTLPNNTTKIRNYPTVLTDNFSAIEEGDLTLKHWQVNFIERNAVPGAPPPANDPTRADDTMIVFSKQDASSETELFVMDDRNPANIIQFTEDGRLGGTTTNLSINNFSFDGGTTTFDENNVINAHGAFNSAGTAIYVNACTVAKAGTGRYNVTFSTARANTNYAVTAICDDTGNSRVAKLGNVTVNGFQLHVVQKDGNSRDIGCRFMVVGGF